MFGVWNAWTHPWSRSRRTRSCRSRRTSAWDSVCRSRTPGLPWDVCHWCGCRVRFPAKYWGTGRIYNKMEMTKCKKNWSEDLEIHQHKYLTPLIRFDITFLIDLNYSILRCSRTLDLHLQLLPLMRVRLGVVDSSQREDSPTRVSLCQLTRTVNTLLQRLPAHHQPHPPDTWLSRGPPTHSHTPVTTATPTRSNWLHLWLSSFTVSSVFFNILPGLYLL